MQDIRSRHPNAPPALVGAPAEGAAVEPGELLVVEVSDGGRPIDLVAPNTTLTPPVASRMISARLVGRGPRRRPSAVRHGMTPGAAPPWSRVSWRAGRPDSPTCPRVLPQGPVRLDEGWVELTICATFEQKCASTNTRTTYDSCSLAGTGADGFADALDATRATSTLAHPGKPWVRRRTRGGVIRCTAGPSRSTPSSARMWTPRPRTISVHFDGNVVGYEAYAVRRKWRAPHDMVVDVVAPRVTAALDERWKETSTSRRWAHRCHRWGDELPPDRFAHGH